MLEIIGNYYEDAGENYRHKRLRGHIYEALVPYSGEEKPQRLKVVSAEPGAESWFEVEEVSLDDIRHASVVPELDTKEREARIVRHAKCRRVVLLSSPPDQWSSGGAGSEPVYLVAPIYGFKSRDEEKHRSLVKAYGYNTLFWIPGDENYAMHEGCIRLDRVQPVHSSLLEGKQVKLTEYALWALTAWYAAYVTGKITERIAEYRTEALRQIREKG